MLWLHEYLRNIEVPEKRVTVHTVLVVWVIGDFILETCLIYHWTGTESYGPCGIGIL